MGFGYLAELYALHSSAAAWKNFTQGIVPAADIQFPMSADVLVGSQLSSYCS
jgi:hypothetical protein